MSAPGPFDGLTVSNIETLLGQSAEGRAFLEAQSKGAETRRVLAALAAFEQRLTRNLDGSQFDYLRRELNDMSKAIAQARADITAMRPQGEDGGRIMAATEELDAIVSATERATGDILSAAEKMFAIAAGMRNTDPQTAAALNAAATEICTACSFQDITGQRTAKVVNVLRYLEHRVHALIDLWNEGPKAAQAQDARPDAHLMNGPAKDGEGIAQDDVDRLMQSAGGPEASTQDAIDALFS